MPRRGTEAAKLPGAVPDNVAQRRFLDVLRAIEGNALTRNRARIGSAEEIYVRHGRTGEGHAIGETGGDT